MMRKLRLLLILVVVALAAATAAVVLSSRADARQRADEAQTALRRAVEFLKPDTASDLRFGKGRGSTTPAPGTPVPTEH